MLRNTCVIALVLVAFCVGSAQASLLFTLDPAVLPGMPGDTLTFSGTLSNTFDYELFLNGNSLTFSGSDTDFVVSGLLGSVPLSLMPAGDSSGGDTYTGSVFDVQILSSAASGSYAGSYSMLGGADDQTQDELAASNFQVNVTAVPEPSSIIVVVGGLGSLLAFRRRGEWPTPRT